RRRDGAAATPAGADDPRVRTASTGRAGRAARGFARAAPGASARGTGTAGAGPGRRAVARCACRTAAGAPCHLTKNYAWAAPRVILWRPVAELAKTVSCRHGKIL